MNITSPTNGAELTVVSSQYPLVVPIAGNVSVSGTGSPGLDDTILNVLVGPPGSEVLEHSRNDLGSASSANWGFNYQVLEEGIYNIKASATRTHADEANDESSVMVTEGQDVTLIVARPAAPAVAGKLLADNNASHKYGKNGNHIADVAKEMGPGTDFRGSSKRDTDYEDKIDRFLVSKGAY